MDDSYPCVFTRACADGEIVTIGVYVDNLQIVHSVPLNASGVGLAGSYYNEFVTALKKAWGVVDEGPMEDLLGIEVEHLRDGAIKLHQRKYIEKVVSRFLPKGALAHVQKSSLPYSHAFMERMVDALSRDAGEYPERMRAFQERIGCLMYAATSTRPDIAFAVHQLCKCLQKPTPALIHLFSYLARHADVGLTYTKAGATLAGYADASWEVAHSTYIPPPVGLCFGNLPRCRGARASRRASRCLLAKPKS